MPTSTSGGQGVVSSNAAHTTNSGITSNEITVFTTPNTAGFMFQLLLAFAFYCTGQANGGLNIHVQLPGERGDGDSNSITVFGSAAANAITLSSAVLHAMAGGNSGAAKLRSKLVVGPNTAVKIPYVADPFTTAYSTYGGTFYWLGDYHYLGVGIT